MLTEAEMNERPLLTALFCPVNVRSSGGNCRAQVLAAPTTTVSGDAGDDKSVDAEFATETLPTSEQFRG